MNPHLIKKACEWFDNIEKWQAFRELANAQADICEQWFIEATIELREQWLKEKTPEWDLVAWDNGRDTWWYLTEFGIDSVGVGFGWRYSWCLHSRGSHTSRLALQEALKTEKYAALRNAFGIVHEYGSFQGIALAQHQSFMFGSDAERQMNLETLAWHAGHEPSKFIAQAISKVNAFTNAPEITNLMIELNNKVLD